MNLKKIIRKDVDGNSMSFEFDIPKANVPPVDSIPNYDHPGEPKGSDTVPAWLTPGENIVNAEASRLPGNQQIIDQMNNQGRAIQAQQGGSIPTYADGGGFIDIARTATDYAPYALASIGLPASLAGLWTSYKSRNAGGIPKGWKPIGWKPYPVHPFLLRKSEGGPVYAAKGTESAPDTSWVDGILDALRFVESGEITDPSKLISSAGAEGFYQIMPANFGELTEKDDAGNVTKTYKGKGAAGYDTPVISREDAYDPEKARAWAKAYLTNMQLAHPEWSPSDVLRAYNWGPGNMKKFMREDVSWDEVPTEAKEYTDKVFKHYKNLTGENFYDTTSNAPELAGLRNAIPVPGETDIPSGDLSMAELMIPDYPVDSSVEIDADGPGQNLKIGPGGVPDMPMNFMGSANPRRGYESGQDYMNTFGLIDPFSRQVSKIYDGAPSVSGMDSLYQTYPKEIPWEEHFGVNPVGYQDPVQAMYGMGEVNVPSSPYEGTLLDPNTVIDGYEDLKTQELLNAARSGAFGPFPAASIDGDEFAKAAGAVGLPTDNDTLNQIVDMVNRENISPQEAAAKIKEMSITPLTNAIQGPDTDPNAPEVNPSNYLFTSGAGINVPGAGETPIPTLDEMFDLGDYDKIQEDINKIQSSNQIEHDTRVPTLDMEKYGDLLTSPPYTEGFEGVPFTEQMSQLHEAIKEKFESADNTSSLQAILDGGPNADSVNNQELKESKKKAEEFRAAEEKAAEQVGMTTESLSQDRVDKLSKQFSDMDSTEVTEDTTTVENKYKEAYKDGRGTDLYKQLPPENKVAGFFKDLLGDIFDVKELKRAAVMYLGGRLLGYSHASAGNFAVKNMLTRMDNQETTRAANIKEWMGSYSPKTLQLYKETGDLSVLEPIGASVYRQGVYQDWYGRGKNGQPVKIRVEKVHVGSGDKKQVKWYGSDGKEYRKEDFSLDVSDYPKSDEYLDKNTKFQDRMEELITKIRTSDGRRGEKKDGGWNYATNVKPQLAAEHAVTWARENNIDLSRLGDIVNMAMLDMISQSDNERADGMKPEYIEGYLNSAIIKQAGGEPGLFQVDPGNPAAGGVNAKEFAHMKRNIGHLLLRSGQSDSLTDISNYINTYAELWNGTAQYEGKPHPENLSDADRKKWEGKKLKDTTPFFEWLQNEIALDQKEFMK